MRHTAGAYAVGPFLLLHQWVYRSTGGAVGRHVGGRPALLLHTTGRKTGQPRMTALVYTEHGDDYLVVASYGGAPRHPAWFLNLQADPRVEIQIGRRRQPARARVAEGDERDRLWQVVNRHNRGLAPLVHRGALGRYDVYQRHTTRQIPVVVLEPDTPAPTTRPYGGEET